MYRIAVFLALTLLALAPAALVSAATDPYTVTNIPVDATAASATEAQTIAINSGKARALQIVLARLVKKDDIAKIPVLDDVALTRLIASYLPQNVRRSTTRYVASMTYSFNPAAIRHLLRSAAIAYTDTTAHPIMIVAMAPRWVSHSAWANAWANPKFASGAVPLVSPVGDTVDAGALSALNFSDATWQDVEPAASRVHANEAMLVLLGGANGQTVIKMKRLGLGKSPPVPDATVPGNPPGTIGAAADAASVAIANYWKSRSAIDYGRRFKLVAEAQVMSLQQWGELLARVGTVSTITDVNVNAMDIGLAKVTLTYVGTADQLHDALNQAKVDLSQKTGGGWTLAAQTSDNSEAATP
ncbi:MAG TPA: DUF2066 domain-containing protein [Rhizomicrobium sp.]|jgi:hypothetical protein|nr:DUF2066 domain-containing protein [Rhizomicrobium sp.]